jgi:drug/metabolite transporter (DMT)-like permease
MERTNQPPGVSTLALFSAAVVLGGGNFVAVRFSNLELAPFWGAALRFALAGSLFAMFAARLRLTWPRGRQLGLIVVNGLLAFAISYALMYWALVRMSAGSAAVILAMVPLVTVILASAQHMERLSRRTLLGAVIALFGILGMTVGGGAAAIPLGSLFAVLLAAFSISQSVIVTKKVSNHHPVMVNAVGMLTGAPVLFALSALAGEAWILPAQPRVITAVAYLVTLGSVGLFILVLRVARAWTASATSYMFVLFPVVTMLLEAAFLGERLTAQGLLGAVIVMAGVWLGAIANGSGASTTASADVPSLPEGVQSNSDSS